MQFSPALWGIPVVASTVDRDVLFPTPQVNQRVYNTATGAIEIWTGVSWAPLLGVGPAFGIFTVTDPKYTQGATTITSAILQACIDACGAAGGGIVFMPGSATYALTENVAINAAKVRLVGQGYATNLVCSFSGAQTHNYALTAVGHDDVGFQDFRLSGACGSGIAIQNCNRPRVTGLYVSGATQNNASDFSVGLFVSGVDAAVIDGNTFTGNGNASGEGHADILCNLGSSQITNSRITNNRCVSTLVNFNIGLFDPQNCLIEGNECANAVISSVSALRQGYGIMLYGTSGVSLSLVRDNVIANNRIRDTQGTGIYNLATANSVIVGNEIVNTCSAQDDSSLAVAGIAVSDTNSAGAVVSGNKVRISAKDGICVLLANKVQVTGNNVADADQAAIAIRGAIADVGVDANMISNPGIRAIGSSGNAVQSRIMVRNNTIRTLRTAGVTVGISACALSDAWDISGNTLSDANGRGQDVSGTNHVAHHNVEDGTPWREAVSANRGDASVTLGALDRITQRFGTALTADRVVTLPSAPLKDARFRVVCENPNSHTLTIKDAGGGTIKALSSSVGSYADVEWSVNDGGWRQTSYGTL